MPRRPVDKVVLLAAAREAAEDLIRRIYRLEVGKALDPTDPDDFLVIRARLASELKGITGPIEGAALKSALDTLDVDWPSLSADGRLSVIAAARDVLNDIPREALPAVTLAFDRSGKRIMEASRKATAQTIEYKVSGSLSQVDERVADFIRQSQSLYVRDEYGARADDYSERAREIVADSLEEGLGRDEIGERLEKELGPDGGGLARMSSYWDNIATIFANRARNFSAVSTMDEAGLDFFRFDAVMDEVTSRVCRAMNGRVFSVERAMDRFRQVAKLKDPEKVAELQPFVSESSDEEGGGLTIKGPGGRRSIEDLSDDELEAAGVAVPPLHGNCRSTIVAVDSVSEGGGGEE